MITLSGFTAVFAITMPSICMPVLFQEISNDLDLSLVELGTIWGMGGLAGIFTTFIGGLIGDRYGTKRTLAVACILAGIAGATRGFSVGFISLAVTMFFFGFFTRTMSLNLHKTAGVWFSGRQVVIANGIVASGFGGICLMSVINGQLIWPLVIVIGLFRDGYYATIATMVIETDGIGGAYAGTATGVVWTLGAFGSFIAPPPGNSLAGIDPGLPFIFWGSMLILPLFLFHFIKEQKSIVQ